MTTHPELAAHLRAWVGAWPPPGRGLHVVACHDRLRPGWDGQVRRLLGATTADGAGIVTVAPRLHRAVADLLDGLPLDELRDRELREAVGGIVAGEGAVLGAGVLRWATEVTPELDDVGVWLRHDDPRVPAWLHPFGGEALVALVDDAYVGGVGVKRHDPTGHELSVVVDPDHRGEGLARRLVATAARHELAEVPVVTYLHAHDNVGSARVADAVGFPDRGWQVLGVFGGDDGE